MSLITRWTLNYTTADSGSNNLPLTSNGGNIFTEYQGKACVDFTDNQTSNLYNATGVTVPRSAGAIMFWINFNDVSTNQDIFGIDSVNGYISLMEYYSTGVFGTETLNNCNSFNSPALGLVNDTWYHIAVVFNSNLAYWYKNGEFVGSPSGYGTNNCSATVATEMLDNVRINYLGAGAYSGNFKGRMADFRVYNHAVPADDLYAIANKTASITSNSNFEVAEISESDDPTPNILDYTTWTESATSAIGFDRNGDSAENEIIIDDGPFGETLVWYTKPSGNSGADGGWNTPSFSIDNTKLYRFTVWVRNTGTVNSGNFYHGLYGYPSAVIEMSTGTSEGNPYWDCPGIGSIPSEWTLSVGHCYPYNTTETGKHPNTGRWSLSGTKLSSGGCNIGTGDVKWASNGTTARERVYHYYSTSTNAHLQFAFPRVEIVDGTEPSIQQLINNFEVYITDKLRCGEIDETTGTSGDQKAQILEDGTVLINGEFIEE
jgi:hypothetical protein